MVDNSSESLRPEDLTIEVLPDDFSQYDLTFKIIVIGDSCNYTLLIRQL